MVLFFLELFSNVDVIFTPNKVVVLSDLTTNSLEIGKALSQAND